MMRPSVPSPTGTLIGVPVSSTALPRVRPYITRHCRKKRGHSQVIMALHSRFICAFLAMQLAFLEAALLRGVQMKEEGKIDAELALLQAETAPRHRDEPDFDDD